MRRAIRTSTTDRTLARRADVLALTSTFPRHGDDPAGRFLLELFEALPRRVDVLCPDDPLVVAAAQWTPLDVGRFTHAGLFYGAGALGNRRSGHCGPLRTTRSLTSMARAAWRAARHAPIVWSHWAVPAGLVGAACTRRTRSAHVLTLHSADVWWLEQHALGALLARRIARRCRVITAPSHDLASRFERLAEQPVRILGCGVHEHPAPAQRRPGPARAGTLSRLVPGKGTLELLSVADEFPGDLHLAGDGPLASRVSHACSRTGATWHGALTGQAKADYLANLDVFLAPYGRTPWDQPEGLPVAVLEALAAGLPVVAYASAAPREVVRDDNAVLVPDGDMNAFVRATRDLLRDAPRRERLAAAARRSAEPWLMPAVTRRWEALFDELTPQ